VAAATTCHLSENRRSCGNRSIVIAAASGGGLQSQLERP
jgi:hypothetical protein